MGFEDDMIENGFTNGNDYIEHLMDEADRIYQQQEEKERKENEYEEWLSSLSMEDILIMRAEEFEKKREREEKNRIEKLKRLNEERILKQWALDYPQKARLWYAHYAQSTSLDNSNFISFFEKLGNSSIDNCMLCELWGDFKNWEHWVEKYDSYQEFKTNTPNEWFELKVDKYKEHIQLAAQHLMKYSDDIYEYECEKHASLTAKKFVNKWINCHSKIWEDIRFKYCSTTKTDKDYLFQAWQETFKWKNAFEVWKIKNHSEWLQFRVRCDKGLIIDESELYKEWVKTNIEEWQQWKLSQSKLWKQFYEYHKQFLWCVYTEIAYLKYLKDAERTGENRAKLSIKEMRFNNARKLFFSDEKYWFLEHEDPRKIYKCKNNRSEDEIHDIIIAQHNKEIQENKEKLLYIQEHCSELDFNKFCNRTRECFSNWASTSIRLEESFEEYADRKVFELWNSQHKIQWNKWKYHYCWAKTYSNCHYTMTEYYEVWKQKNFLKWEKWVTNKFEFWLQNAKNVDIWYAWLLDNNEWDFHQWASYNLKNWNNLMEEEMKFDYKEAYINLFNLNWSNFDKWKKSNPKEWKYWKDALTEQILIDEFSLKY